jgi:hypothetical protein
MRRLPACAIVLLVSPLVGSWFGCGSSTPPPPASPASHGETSNLSDILASWNSGKKEIAVEQLLSIRWGDSSAFAEMPNVTLSEKDFMSLSSDEQTRIQKTLWPALKHLARYALSTGDNAAPSSDKETAKAHSEAVVHLGEALSSPEHSLLIQLFGKTIVEMATKDKASAEK